MPYRLKSNHSFVIQDSDYMRLHWNEQKLYERVQDTFYEDTSDDGPSLVEDAVMVGLAVDMLSSFDDDTSADDYSSSQSDDFGGFDGGSSGGGGSDDSW